VLEGTILFEVTRPRPLVLLKIFKMKLSRYHWWYDTDGTEMEHWEKTPFLFHPVHHKSPTYCSDSKAAIRSETRATNRMSYGTLI